MVVGASFGGLQVASELSGVDVTVVDGQDYWEFTPSMHTALAGSRVADGLLVPLGEKLVKGVTFVKGKAVGIEEGVLLVDGKIKKIPFDYLVLATGCDYSWPIRSRETVLADRKDAVLKSKEALTKAKSILVVGGGAVGVEMAAEMAYKGGEAKITLATNAPELLLDLPEATRVKALAWLKDHGVDLKFNCKVTQQSEGLYELKGNKDTSILKADDCFWCIGGRPRTAFLKDILPLDARGFVVVDERLKVSSSTINAFAVGDVAAKADAQRLASYAHFEGEYVAKVIMATIRKQTLPTAYVAPPRFVALSLGPKDGAFIYDSLHMSYFPGFLVPALKTVIELWFIRLLPMPYAILKLLPGDYAARLWSKPPRAATAARAVPVS